MIKITSILLTLTLILSNQPFGYSASPLTFELATAPVSEVSTTVSSPTTPTTIYDPNTIESPLTPVESPTPIATLYEPVSPVRTTTIYSTSLTSSNRPRRDRTPPEISSITTNDITSVAATINWMTNEGSDTQIEYGLTSFYGLRTTLNTNLVNNHSQTISGLNPDTLYHYRVRSRDAAGNLTVSGDFTFRTLIPTDTTAPVISAMRTMKITSTAGTILWTTDEASDTQIEYGTTTSYGSSTTVNTAMVTNHSQTISGLAASTLYHYRVKSRDAQGNIGVSADFTFTTLALTQLPPPPLDTTPPVISGVATSALTRTGVTINWNANEASDTQIEYGLTTSYGNSTTLNSTLVTVHSQSVSNLQASTLYHYRVLSRDVAGNLQTSGDFIFTTNANGLPVLSHITATPSDVDSAAAGIQEYAGTSVSYQTSATDPNSDPVSLSWSYSVNGGASVNYGTEPSVTYNYSLNDAGKTYVWTVTANDGFGSVTQSVTINIINPPDTAAPIINNVVSTDVTESAATITWTTDEASDSQVEYRIQGSTTWLAPPLDPSMVTSHSLAITGLALDTAYEYQVKSKDQAGNLATQSTLSTFRTLAPPQGPISISMNVVFDHEAGHLFIITKSELERQFGSFNTGTVQTQLTDANGNPIAAKMVFAGGDLYIVSDCEGDVIGSGTLSLDGRSASLSASMVNCELHPPMTMTPTMMENQQSMDALFPVDQVTYRAVQSGNFEDAATWGGTTPTAGARILIENAVVVVNSQLSQNYRWIFVGHNGALVFNPNVNTSLTTTTIGVGEGGLFFMGTKTNPIASNVTARIQFTPRDAAGLIEDIHDLDGGFLAAHGSEISIVGAETTSGVNAAVIPQAGATQITLSQVPTNWRVGGHIMLPATSDLLTSVNLANEEFVITAISADRLTITLDHAIMKTPNIPSNFSLPIIYLDRNVQFASTDTSTRLNRAHMMFMSPAVIEYASLMGMGRGDKMRPVTDTIPPTDPNSNQRGRYALHFHRVGYEEEALARGVVIRDTPGWQFVNHSSFVRFEDNVAIGAVGAAYVTEAGDEIGFFERNIAVGVTGTGDADNARSEAKDYGYRGNGFWLQGTAVNIFENSVWNVASAGIGIYAQALAGSDKGDPTTIPVSILHHMLDDPSIFADAEFISPTQFPMQIRGNTVVGAMIDGIRTYYLGQGNENIRFVIEGNYVANVGERGISTQYASNFDILNNVIDNSMITKGGGGNSWTSGQDSGGSGHISFEGNTVIGFPTGAFLPPNGVTYVRNNLFDLTSFAISIREPLSTGRVNYIENNTFGPNTLIKVNLTYQNDFSAPDRRMFDPDKILYTEAGQPTVQLFFREQAADFVPYQNTGTILDGLTNAQMWNLYRIAIGGAVVPEGSVYGTAQKINAYIGTPVSFVRPLFYTDRTTNPTYVAKFTEEDKTVVYEAAPVTLHPGVNVIPTGGIDPLTGAQLVAIVEYVSPNPPSIELQYPIELTSAVVSSLDTSIFISVKAIFTYEGGLTAAPTFNATVPLIHLGDGTAVANFVIVDPVTRAEYWQSIIFTVSSLIDAHLYPDWWRS